jgi:hypothetical protein
MAQFSIPDLAFHLQHLTVASIRAGPTETINPYRNLLPFTILKGGQVKCACVAIK